MNQSSSEPLVYLDSRSGSSPRRSRPPPLLLLALVGAAVNLVLVISLAVFVSSSMASLQQRDVDSKKAAVDTAKQVESVHFVIDHSRLRICPTSPTMIGVGGGGDSQLPCLQKDGRYLTSDQPLGPWKCSITSTSTSTSTSSSTSSTSNCSPLAVVNGSRIEVLKQGFYLLVAQILVVDSLPSPVALLASVNGANWAACAHNATGSQLPCAITATRRMRPGDWLALGVPQAYRLIDSHYTLTYVDLTRLAD